MLEPLLNADAEKRSRKIVKDVRRIVRLSKRFKKTIINKINNRCKNQVLEKSNRTEKWQEQDHF